MPVERPDGGRGFLVSRVLNQINSGRGEEETWSTESIARPSTNSSRGQVELIESASIPKLLADVVELRLRHENVSREEVRAIWLGAALATHVGLAILEEPERFVTAAEPTPRRPGGGRRVTRKEEQDMQTMDRAAFQIEDAVRPLWFGGTPPAWGDVLRTVHPSDGQDAASMIDAAGLGWTVEQCPLEAVLAIGEDGSPAARAHVPRHVANVRSDTRAVLGVVGEGYEPLQNRAAFAFCDDITDSGHRAWAGNGPRPP